MPHYIATISIIVNGQTLKYVEKVSAKQDTSHLGAFCDVKVPINSIVAYKPKNSLSILTSYNLLEIPIGGAITITAQYQDGETGIYLPTVQIFDGFVYDFVEDMPLTIKCIDHSYKLNLTFFSSLNFPGASDLKTVISRVLAGTGITALSDNVNFQTQDLSFTNMSAAAILTELKKELFFNISLLGDQLYANVASNTTNSVSLDTSINVKKSGLQNPNAAFQEYMVTVHYKLENGKKATYQLGTSGGVNRDVNMCSKPYALSTVQMTAQQALAQVKMKHFEGQVTTPLYPVIPMYAKVPYTDVEYPDKSGDYVCIAREFDTSDAGYEWKYKLAPLLPLEVAS